MRQRPWAGLLGLALALAGCRGAPSEPERPNVLFIVADDLSFRIGLYGFEPPTPQLTRLAARGRRFDRAYAQYPLCSPSRTSLLTGWRPETTRVWGNLGAPRHLIQAARPLQELFQAQGYFTARVGKMYHSRFEEEFRWERIVDTYDPTPDDAALEQWWGASGRSDEDEPDGRAARAVVELMQARRARPFFIGVGFLKPHLPWIVPERHFAAHPPESVELPPAAPAQVLGARRGASLEIPVEQWRDAIAAYRASVSFMDAQLGVILDALDRLALWETTVVVLLSDHGVHVGEHGLWGKTTLFEESARVPLVIAAPGLARPGTPTGRIVELVDLYPTLVELCRLPRPAGLEGTSLVPLLADPGRAVKRAAFTMRKVGATRLGQVARSVRTERWRYTQWPRERPYEPELYDHEADPWEHHNLAGDPAHADTLQAMRRLLETGPRVAGDEP